MLFKRFVAWLFNFCCLYQFQVCQASYHFANRMILCEPCVARFPDDSDRFEDNTFVTYPHKVGNNLLMYGKRTSRFPYHVFIGPEWPCMLFTYNLIIIPSIFFFKNIAVLWGPGCIIGGVVTMLTLLSYFSLTALSDPGIVFESVNHDLESASMVNYIECGHCNIKRPQTASHCYDCNVCVDELDHHCPWTGKCIGKKNLKYFYGFLWSILLHLTYVIIFVGLTFAYM